MKRKEVKKIGSLLSDYVKANHLEDGLSEYRIIKSWPELLGVSVSKKTKSLVIKNRKLIVYLNSSVVRNELMMIKETLIQRLNEVACRDAIDDIILK